MDHLYWRILKNKNLPSIDPAARPIDLAKTGGMTPNGFSLSVKPSLSKSTKNTQTK